jgi:hypothetical protein
LADRIRSACQCGYLQAEGHSTETNTMRLSLLSLTTLAGLYSLTAGPATLAATRMSLVQPDSRVTEVHYYHNGHRYNYYWNHRYYNHRYYRGGHWHYY